MENEKISDKLAGHAPAKMVGGKRVPARVRNNSSTSKLVDTTNVVKANVGGFDGNVVTEKVEKDELAPSDVKNTDGGKSDHVQKHAPVPKNQQSHKPAMNQNINQPKNFWEKKAGISMDLW